MKITIIATALLLLAATTWATITLNKGPSSKLYKGPASKLYIGAPATPITVNFIGGGSAEFIKGGNIELI
jgi:hypothetical protein